MLSFKSILSDFAILHRLHFAAYIGFGTPVDPLSMSEGFYGLVCLKLVRLNRIEVSYGELRAACGRSLWALPMSKWGR